MPRRHARATGVVAGTTFKTVSSTKRYRRYGVNAHNSSGADPCYAPMPVDRRSNGSEHISFSFR